MAARHPPLTDDVPPDPELAQAMEIVAVLQRIALEQHRRARALIIGWTIFGATVVAWLLYLGLAALGFI